MSSTNTRAWILTLLRYACQVASTLRANHTLWLTLYVWVTNVVFNTFACCGLALFRTVSIYAAGGGVAGVDCFNWSPGCDFVTVDEGVPDIALVTHTHWYMVPNSAVCVITTQTRAGILAFLTLAC